MKTNFNTEQQQQDAGAGEMTTAEQIKEQLTDPVFYIKTAVGAAVGLIALSLLSAIIDG